MILSQETHKLFDAISEYNLENFQDALNNNVDVNALQDVVTPLMLINTIYSDDGSSEEVILHKMAKLLVRHFKINIKDNVLGSVDIE
jgi:hypothetical protein